MEKLALNNEKVVIRGVDFRSLGALGMPFAAPSLSLYTGFNSSTYRIRVKKDTLQVVGLIPGKEMRFLKKTIQRRRVFVVAGAIRLKVLFFLAYRGRHPQSAEAVLAGILIHSSCIGTFVDHIRLIYFVFTGSKTPPD